MTNLETSTKAKSPILKQITRGNDQLSNKKQSAITRSKTIAGTQQDGSMLQTASHVSMVTYDDPYRLDDLHTV